MSRAQDLVRFEARNPQTSTAGTVTNYFAVGSRPIMVKNHLILGLSPSEVDGDTFQSVWDYSTDGGANYTTISDTGADEYNDTDDTNALGDHGTDSAVVTFNTSELNTRVAAGAIVRHREVTAGTVTNHWAHSYLEYISI